MTDEETPPPLPPRHTLSGFRNKRRLNLILRDSADFARRMGTEEIDALLASMARFSKPEYLEEWKKQQTEEDPLWIERMLTG